MTETAADHERSGTAVWLEQRRLKIAIGIAVLEGIVVALSADFSRWTVIIVSAPIIAFYVLAGRSLESDTGRQISWILAAAQAFAILLCVVALLIGSFALMFRDGMLRPYKSQGLRLDVTALTLNLPRRQGSGPLLDDVSFSVLPGEFVATRAIADWKKKPPDLDRRPAVFLLYRGS